MIWIAVVDDDAEERSTLSAHFQKLAEEIREELNITLFSSGSEFLNSDDTVYDLICLDIDMPGKSGMETAQILRKRNNQAEIIFVTNLAQMALQGYSVHALDFIVKPVSYSSFVLKMRSTLQMIVARKSVTILLVTGDGMRKIPSDQLYYAEISGHHLCYHTAFGEFSQKASLSGLEEKLTGQPFKLCNQCYLVNLKHVAEIRKDEVLVGNDWLKISRPRKKQFMEALAHYMGGTGND